MRINQVLSCSNGSPSLGDSALPKFTERTMGGSQDHRESGKARLHAKLAQTVAQVGANEKTTTDTEVWMHVLQTVFQMLLCRELDCTL